MLKYFPAVGDVASVQHCSLSIARCARQVQGVPRRSNNCFRARSLPLCPISSSVTQAQFTRILYGAASSGDPVGEMFLQTESPRRRGARRQAQGEPRRSKYCFACSQTSFPLSSSLTQARFIRILYGFCGARDIQVYYSPTATKAHVSSWGEEATSLFSDEMVL